jgi:hypothetical protein
MKRKFVVLALATAAAAVTTGVLATPGASAEPAGTLRLSVLSRAQVAADALPSFLPAGDLGNQGLLAGSTRLLGAAQGARHWAAEDRSGEVCLVSVLGTTAADQITGVTCAPVAQFAKEGLSLQVTGPGKASEAHLLPDGYAGAARSVSGLVMVSDNLAVSDPNATGPSEVVVGSGSSRLTLKNLTPATEG